MINYSNARRILIIDDKDAIRKLLQRKLSSSGYQCLEASNAGQALERLKNNPVDLALLDIRMPGKSGTDLLPEIKSSYPDTAVIMATASTDANIAIQCMKQGAYDYLTKPFNLDEVALSVNRALEKRQLELEIKEYQQHLEDKVAEQAEKIRVSFLSSITALAYALEAKDKYTSGHSQRVADIAVAIANVIGLPQEITDKIRLAGLLHDIGKIGVKESVLNKPGRLTYKEFLHVQEHSKTGERILVPITDDKELLRLVRSHHERYNGTGYPDGLRNTQIGLGARILAIADVYEAMTSERPYRNAISTEAAYAEIERGGGTHFDPEVVLAFFTVISSDIKITTDLSSTSRDGGR
ncbi:HD domain-containing phosphohydrolase [Chloroflexota bacterium]